MSSKRSRSITPARVIGSSFRACSRQLAGGGRGSSRVVLCHLAPAGVEFAFLDDAQEQLFQRGGGVVDHHVIAAVAVDHVADFIDR